MLFCDSREAKATQELMLAVAGPGMVMKLECGDFALFDKDGHSLGIERKEVGDLLNSLREKQANGVARLPDQLARMAMTYDYRILLIEGDMRYDDDTHKLGTRRRMSGWLASVVFLMLWGFVGRGTAVLTTTSRLHSAEILRVLHKRSLAGCVLPSGVRPTEEAMAA